MCLSIFWFITFFYTEPILMDFNPTLLRKRRNHSSFSFCLVFGMLACLPQTDRQTKIFEGPKYYYIFIYISDFNEYLFGLENNSLLSKNTIIKISILYLKTFTICTNFHSLSKLCWLVSSLRSTTTTRSIEVSYLVFFLFELKFDFFFYYLFNLIYIFAQFFYCDYSSIFCSRDLFARWLACRWFVLSCRSVCLATLRF